MKKLIFILLLFTACKKDAITLSGAWVAVDNGITSTIVFEGTDKYYIESYLITGNIKTQTCALYGTYKFKGNGIAFRTDGQTFDWGISGKIDDKILSLKEAKNNNKLIFVRQ